MFIKMYEDVVLPIYETVGSAGMDVRFFEPHIKQAVIYGQTSLNVGTGLKVQLDRGWELQVRSRSGMAFKAGICVLNAPGTIDSDYGGEIRLILRNTGDAPLTLKKFDRVAQLVYAPTFNMPGVQVGERIRGEGGFGHTGTK